jgi:hypothetical protein
MNFVLSLIAGRDLLHLGADDAALLALARMLWAEAPPGSRTGAPLRLTLRAVPGAVETDPEEELEWDLSAGATRLTAPGLELTVRPHERTAEGWVARGLLSSRPGLVTRLLLEAPVTAMKMVGQQLLHAGAVVGPAGAVVVRGAAGAGKSTLVAACWKAGLGLLGDESLLVDRGDPDLLEATLRDLALTEGSARLLGLEASTEPAFSGGERKRRLPLLATASPSDRTARRAATILLGPRQPGPASLVPISGRPFLEVFAAGEIPQERFHGGVPDATASAWDGRGTFLLSGASDLEGAVRLVAELAGGIRRPFVYTQSQ